MINTYVRNDLDRILEGLDPCSVEERREYNVEPACALLIPKYEQLCRVEDRKKYLQEMDDVLSPLEINSLAQLLYHHTPVMRYQGMIAVSTTISLFLTTLIQNSYDSGYNDFILDTAEFPNYKADFGIGLHGVSQKPLTLLINGDLGRLCFAMARYVKATIQGSVGLECGFAMKNSSIHITGDAQYSCGDSSSHSSFHINNGTDFTLRHGTKFSTFFVNQIDEVLTITPIKVYGCSFISPDTKTIEKFIRAVPLGNRIIFQEGEHQRTQWWNHFVARITT